MATTPLAVSVIVPAFREAPNLTPLTERVFAALTSANIAGELIIVDDNSQDGSDSVVESLQDRYHVRLVVRLGQRGLSGAVIRGFEEARADTFVVMDADLQHPPETIPQLLEQLGKDSCEFVLATRYATRGSIDSSWPLRRRLASLLGSLIARPLVKVSDPMSGFFALRRDVWQRSKKLDSIGYKIALEILVKSRCRKLAEVPFSFATRHAGTSKASLRVGLQFFWHLLKLYRYRFGWLLWVAAILTILLAGMAYSKFLQSLES